MQENLKRPKNSYEYAIIGAGLGGLAVASALSRHTTSVALIEASESYAGHTRVINSPAGAVNNGLRLIPNSDLSRKALGFLEYLVGQPIFESIETSPPMTFEGGNIKPFVGFGNFSFDFYDELAGFFSAEFIKTTQPIYEWPNLLFETFKGSFIPKSYATRFTLDDDKKKITSVMINGQKPLIADKYIFCGSVKDLIPLLPADALSGRSRQRLAKSPFWTAVCLDLLHEQPVTELPNVHILNGTTQDEIGPCAGVFLPVNEIDGVRKQYSQWITFLQDDEGEDSEVVGAVLKKIKRQIKRAYPSALDGQKFERVLVVPSIAGNGELKLTEDSRLPELENLWIASGQMNEAKNLTGALLQAQTVASAQGPFDLIDSDEIHQ